MSPHSPETFLSALGAISYFTIQRRGLLPPDEVIQAKTFAGRQIENAKIALSAQEKCLS
jgi:hypothetical protein